MSFSVAAQHARSPFVLGLDVGSTGTRGGLCDASGLPVEGCRLKIPHALTTQQRTGTRQHTGYLPPRVLTTGSVTTEVPGLLQLLADATGREAHYRERVAGFADLDDTVVARRAGARR